MLPKFRNGTGELSMLISFKFNTAGQINDELQHCSLWHARHWHLRSFQVVKRAIVLLFLFLLCKDCQHTEKLTYSQTLSFCKCKTCGQTGTNCDARDLVGVSRVTKYQKNVSRLKNLQLQLSIKLYLTGNWFS